MVRRIKGQRRKIKRHCRSEREGTNSGEPAVKLLVGRVESERAPGGLHGGCRIPRAGVDSEWARSSVLSALRAPSRHHISSVSSPILQMVMWRHQLMRGRSALESWPSDTRAHMPNRCPACLSEGTAGALACRRASDTGGRRPMGYHLLSIRFCGGKSSHSLIMRVIFGEHFQVCNWAMSIKMEPAHALGPGLYFLEWIP